MMANVITGLRILVSAVLLFCPVFSQIFYVLYLIAGLSDMVDGIIARKTAAFHASTDVNNSSDYIHGNSDMFSSDICSCSGGILHKDRKAD